MYNNYTGIRNGFRGTFCLTLSVSAVAKKTVVTVISRLKRVVFANFAY